MRRWVTADLRGWAVGGWAVRFECVVLGHLLGRVEVDGFRSCRRAACTFRLQEAGP